MPIKLYSRDVVILQCLRDIEETQTGNTTAMADPHSADSLTKLAVTFNDVWKDVKNSPDPEGSPERDILVADTFVAKLQAAGMLTEITWNAATKVEFYAWLAEFTSYDKRVLFRAELDAFNGV